MVLIELFLFTFLQAGGRIRPGSRDPTALAPWGVPGPPLTRTGSLKACLALSCFMIFKGSECPRKSDLMPFLPLQSPDLDSHAIYYPRHVPLPPRLCVGREHRSAALLWVPELGHPGRGAKLLLLPRSQWLPTP